MRKRGIVFAFAIMFLLCVVCAAGIYRRGSRGATVSEIQTVLKNEGLYQSAVDGIFGEATERAVIQYQKNYGLRADGIVGEMTLASMGLSESAADDSYDNDLYLLSRIISAEARGEPYIGQLAVGAVIMNRVSHPSFPNTIAGVIYQNCAFSALSDGQFHEPISEESRRAAREVLSGVNPVGNAVYYYNPKTATNAWIRSRPVIRTIGAYVFCT